MTPTNRKEELRAELASARTQFSANWAGVKRDANVPRKVRNSVRERKFAWIGGATILGFALSLLRGRKREVVIDAKTQRRIGSRKQAGLLLVVAKLLFGVLRPVLTAYATKKLADMASANVDAREAEAEARHSEVQARHAEIRAKRLPR